MVSASDYENLIALGSYEPVEEKEDGGEEEDQEKPVVMKEVYGKQKSPYKHVATDRQTRGPRHRVVLDSPSQKKTQKESDGSAVQASERAAKDANVEESDVETGEETGEDELLNSLNDLSDIDQYVPKEKQPVSEGEDEQGWSI